MRLLKNCFKGVEIEKIKEINLCLGSVFFQTETYFIRFWSTYSWSGLMVSTEWSPELWPAAHLAAVLRPSDAAVSEWLRMPVTTSHESLTGCWMQSLLQSYALWCNVKHCTHFWSHSVNVFGHPTRTVGDLSPIIACLKLVSLRVTFSSSFLNSEPSYLSWFC